MATEARTDLKLIGVVDADGTVIGYIQASEFFALKEVLKDLDESLTSTRNARRAIDAIVANRIRRAELTTNPALGKHIAAHAGALVPGDTFITGRLRTHLLEGHKLSAAGQDGTALHNLHLQHHKKFAAAGQPHKL